MTNSNTFRGRIQLKSDSEANWNAHPIVPLLGELIIYTADNTHHYPRLKVGDGNTSVIALPFVDAGTINGHDLPEGQVYTYANKDLFPYPGTSNALYVDLSTSIIYCYTPAGGYAQLSNFTYNIQKTNVSNITYWRTGTTTTMSCNDGKLNISTGVTPRLTYETVSVVQNVTKEVVE